MASFKLFPPYLNANSAGEAVFFLQRLLSALLPGFHIHVTGLYGPQSVEAVKILQQYKLNFTGGDVDGNFGPGTRLALAQKFNIYVDAIPASATDVTLWYGPGSDALNNWPVQ